MPSSPSSPASRSLLSLVRGVRSSLGETESEKLEKRRAINRRSQAKSRNDKESLIKRLEEENGRLKDDLELQRQVTSISSTLRAPSEIAPKDDSSPVSSSRYPTAPGVASIDLEACRQAFMAVLASVCDPHLNTIHAVCHKFSESRGLSISGHSLNAPRPVNRPLNLPLDVLSGSNHPYEFPSPSNSSGRSTHLPDLFTTLTPPSDYIPLLGIAGPLSIPFLEPQHPVYGFELDSAGIWTTVLIMVDMSKTDAEALASSLTLRVRCYGFGPVMIEQDVVEICRGFPQLAQSPVGSSG